METLTLIQTGKHDPVPLILVDVPDGTYWLKWFRFCEEELMKQGYISPTDYYLFERVDSPSAVVRCINHFYSRYHSLRYIEKQVAIRLMSGIKPESVETLKDQFQDILTPQGSIYLSGPLPEEDDEPQIAHLPRLIVDFNRKDFGILRRLIDAINSC
jgi:hypothetical protein